MLACCAAVLATSAPATAQPAALLPLAEAQRIAVDRSTQIASQKTMAEAAREMAIPAGELPDPKLIAGLENVPVQGMDRWTLDRDFMTMTRIGIMQDFPRAVKRQLRSERALRDAARVDVAAEVAELAVRREVTTAWLNLHYALRAERMIAAQIAEADLQTTMAGASYRAGRGSQTDVLAAQGMVLELRNRLIEAQLATQRARIALARHVGDASERALGDVPDVSQLPLPPARLTDVEMQPEVRVVDAQTAILDTEAQLAHAGRLPDWSAELSYAIRGSRYDNMVTLMVRMDLPWSPGTRQDREYAAKLKERDATRQMREDARRMREAEVRQMLVEWEAMRAQAARMRDELLPLARQRTESALASYRGGMGQLTMVLESRRAELDTELSLINMELAAARAWAWLSNVVLPAGQS